VQSKVDKLTHNNRENRETKIVDAGGFARGALAALLFVALWQRSRGI
jgi:hypothetical protein